MSFVIPTKNTSSSSQRSNTTTCKRESLNSDAASFFPSLESPFKGRLRSSSSYPCLDCSSSDIYNGKGTSLSKWANCINREKNSRALVWTCGATSSWKENWKAEIHGNGPLQYTGGEEGGPPGIQMSLQNYRRCKVASDWLLWLTKSMKATPKRKALITLQKVLKTLGHLLLLFF